MKRFLYLYFFIFLVSNVYSQSASLEKDINTVFPVGQRVILKLEDLTTQYDEDGTTKYWEPSKKETEAALIKIKSELNVLYKNNSTDTEIGFIINNISKYKIQFYGTYTESGIKVVNCNFFINDEILNWKHDIVLVFDGGLSYWCFAFNPTNNSIIDFWINGYA